MANKEIVKQEIDRMPDELVEKVYQYIEEHLKKRDEKKVVNTYGLKGAFDQIDTRESAYE